MYLLNISSCSSGSNDLRRSGCRSDSIGSCKLSMSVEFRGAKRMLDYFGETELSDS